MTETKGKMEVIIITGMSGAGRSRAADWFEDQGYYCVDNMPPALITNFLNMASASHSDIEKVVFVADLRSRDFFDELVDVIDNLRSRGDIKLTVLYMEAAVSEVVRRYNEVRRSHPLTGGKASASVIEAEAEKLTGIRKKADLQCRIIQYPQPVVTDESPAPCYPMALFSVDAKSGMALSPAMSTAYRENPDEMMEDFLNTCLQTGIKPGKILVEDERTYAFLKPAADALKIRIEKEDFLEELEEMLSQLQMEFDDGEESFRQHYDELMEMLEMMLTMPAEVVRTLPGEIKEQVRQMIEAGALPADMADQLRKKLKL